MKNLETPGKTGRVGRYAILYRQNEMHGEVEKLTERLLAKLPPSNLVRLCKIQCWKKCLYGNPPGESDDK